MGRNMKGILWIAGIFTIVVAVIGGLLTESVWTFLVLLLLGAVCAVAYYALGKILGKRDGIESSKNRLESPPERGGQIASEGSPILGETKKKRCYTCGKEIDEAKVSCPYCGGKEF